jgi:hypothetical protein
VSPRTTPQQRTRLAAAAAALAVTASLALIATRDYSEHTTEAIHDAGLSRSTGASRVTDLLTAPVEPGELVTTGVSLPRGARVTDVMPAAQFAIESQTHTDHGHGTWYEVTARNQGPASIRFFAFISFDVPATDGGI